MPIPLALCIAQLSDVQIGILKMLIFCAYCLDIGPGSSSLLA